jgi:penicillin-binding protein 1C
VAQLREFWSRFHGYCEWALVGAVLIGLLAFDWATAPPSVPNFARLQQEWQPSQAWLYDRDGGLLDEVRVDFEYRRLAWTGLDRMSPALLENVIEAEDHRFYAHGGVDWLAVAGALRQRFSGGRGGGASTISMQAAAFLWPDLGRPGNRGWVDKFRQMRAAWALEESWNKAEILETYLNLAPFRGESQGVAAGSTDLLGKLPADLDRREAAILTALLPNPGAPTKAIAARACRMMPAAECPALEALADSVTSQRSQRRRDPQLAPHLAVHLLTKPGMKVTSTIDPEIQKLAVSALRHQLEGLGPTRVRDGAVVVVDNATGDVLAYVGGVGLGSTAAQVDGAASLRQAGSTLKPHLYAQLIESEWLTAASILEDSPVQLDTASGLYVPRNYDNQFMGPVSVRRALANSLNVPAVRALMLDGVQNFRDRLWDLGYHDLVEDGSFYGFSLALGTAEVTLLQQANAFRTLANQGQWSPLRLKEDDPKADMRQVVDPGAAWIVGDILSDASARASAFGVDSALRLPFWAAAKTGTSKAMRDNWCVGFSERHTVAVWVGNLEGDPMRAVSGTSGAAPVWRDVMLALYRDRPGVQPKPPADVVSNSVLFAGLSEPRRTEWFKRGTAQAVMAQAPEFARRPRIASPVSGSVYAFDPDIPQGHQSLGVSVTGDASNLKLALNGRVFASADGNPQVPLVPGSHLLTLLGPGGEKLDQVRFTIR